MEDGTKIAIYLKMSDIQSLRLLYCITWILAEEMKPGTMGMSGNSCCELNWHVPTPGFCLDHNRMLCKYNIQSVHGNLAVPR